MARRPLIDRVLRERRKQLMEQAPFATLWISGLPETPIGPIWVASSQNGLAAIEIGGSPENFRQSLAARYGTAVQLDAEKTWSILEQIKSYLRAERTRFELVLDWSGMSEFQRKTLKAVYEIPYGQTRTYGQIAAQIGVPQAPRAIGRANATNPIPLVIPCHRVIGADGRLRGYGSGEGLKTKAWLLALENSYQP
jgi:O-6-methylguanine DNA methyltransferase